MIRRPVLDQLRPYVPGRHIEGGIKLSSNENPFGPSPAAAQAARDAVAEVHRYPDGGMHLLKQAIAERDSISESQIVVGNGSDEIMVMIAGATMEPGCNAVSAAHTFSQYEFATRIYGGEYRQAPMRDFVFDLEEIAALVDSQTRIVWLCNPNNPTGTTFSAGALETFLARLAHDPLVVVDEAYAEFVERDDYPRTLELLGRYPNVIRLRTFSKIYGLAALRIGYGVAQAQVIEAVSSLRQPFNVGSVSQAAAVAALADTAHATETRENNRSGKQMLREFLTSNGISCLDSEANFICAHLGPATEQIVASLALKKIAVRPLKSFRLPEHVRISVGRPQEMETFYAEMETALKRFSGAHA